MEGNIIQHHPVIDFDEYFRNLNQGFVGIDYNDYLTFFKEGEELHSFIGIGIGNRRVTNAFADGVRSNEAQEILSKLNHSCSCCIIRLNLKNH